MTFRIDMAQLAAVLAFIGGAGTTGVLMWTWVIKPARNGFKWLEEFREDWQGTPARPGVAARRGVMERLAGVESELNTNGGSSMRDELKATRQLAIDTQAAVGEIRDQMASATVIALPARDKGEAA